MSLNDVLFLCVCGSAIYARSVSAMLFCAAYAIHSFYSPAMEQWMRYVALILIDSATAFIVCAIDPISVYVRTANSATRRSLLQRLVSRCSWLLLLAESIKRPSRASVITGVFSGVFLAVNSVGLIAWYLYFPPATYDAVCSVVYISMLAALINEGSHGRRRLALHGMGVSSAGATMRKGVGVHQKDAGEV
ncbi:MAG: hypothetical protein ACRC9V_06020 [Aeromonas sp.]